MTQYKKLIIIYILFLAIMPTIVVGQSGELLSSEEELWLKSRNDTILVYAERNNPPYSYRSSGGNLQGLAIDYIELVAKKVGAKIVYITPQSRSLSTSEFKSGKGDVLLGAVFDDNDPNLIFTDSYVTVSNVLVARKDFEKRNNLNLGDFAGRKIAVVNESYLEKYITRNYPRVIIEDVSDDEVALQKVILGEVEASAIDTVTLSFYSSRQVSNVVKIVGHIGTEYKPSFALLKDKTTLQSILEKGMSQISLSDREAINDKWISIPSEVQNASQGTNIPFGSATFTALSVIILIVLLAILALVIKYKRPKSHLFDKAQAVSEIKKEIRDLEGASELLDKEIKIIKKEEDELEKKLSDIEK